MNPTITPETIKKAREERPLHPLLKKAAFDCPFEIGCSLEGFHDLIHDLAGMDGSGVKIEFTNLKRSLFMDTLEKSDTLDIVYYRVGIDESRAIPEHGFWIVKQKGVDPNMPKKILLTSTPHTM
jgi:hypothetical protein